MLVSQSAWSIARQGLRDVSETLSMAAGRVASGDFDALAENLVTLDQASLEYSALCKVVKTLDECEQNVLNILA